MARRYALRDDPWERIQGLLPGREDTVGVTAKDNRLFIEAVIDRYKAVIPWRDLPERFGDWKNTHRRWSRWAESGVWEKIFKHLAADADNACARIDSIARADQNALLAFCVAHILKSARGSAQCRSQKKEGQDEAIGRKKSLPRT